MCVIYAIVMYQATNSLDRGSKQVLCICRRCKSQLPSLCTATFQVRKKSEKEKLNIIKQLKQGVPLIVKNEKLTPNSKKNYTVGDLITGFGVAESILHFYNIYSGKINDKKVIIQGWGNVAGAAAYYLSQAGAKIVGIIDKSGG